MRSAAASWNSNNDKSLSTFCFRKPSKKSRLILNIGVILLSFVDFIQLSQLSNYRAFDFISDFLEVGSSTRRFHDDALAYNHDDDANVDYKSDGELGYQFTSYR